jgi:trans-aconitate 2-methyltransferase
VKPVDLIFSTATFHWIKDHDRLFRRLAQALKPQGRLVAQCEGQDNIARTQNAMEQVMGEVDTRRFSRAWKTPGTLRPPRR